MTTNTEVLSYISALLDNIDPEWTNSFKAKLFEDSMRDVRDMINGTHTKNLELAHQHRESEHTTRLDPDQALDALEMQLNRVVAIASKPIKIRNCVDLHDKMERFKEDNEPLDNDRLERLVALVRRLLDEGFGYIPKEEVNVLPT